MKEFWKIVEELAWDGNYKRCEEYLVRNFTKEKVKEFESIADKLMLDLDTRFQQDWLDKIDVSDDGWSDLRAEVIGRGKEFYEAITVEKLIEMADNNDYTESFIYVFPYKYEEIEAIILEEKYPTETDKLKKENQDLQKALNIWSEFWECLSKEQQQRLDEEFEEAGLSHL